MKTRRTWLIFILMSISIVSVSAYVYESAQQTVNQNIRDVATFTLQNSVLGDTYEGETKTYTKANVAALGKAMSITTNLDGVILRLNSDLDLLALSYSTYEVTVKFIAVPSGSGKSVDTVAFTLTPGSPDPAPITLDLKGTWDFDFEITTTAGSVSSDQAQLMTITATAEST